MPVVDEVIVSVTSLSPRPDQPVIPVGPPATVNTSQPAAEPELSDISIRNNPARALAENIEISATVTIVVRTGRGVMASLLVQKSEESSQISVIISRQ